ncbi:hypothetical protein ACQP2Y_07330 [Actinoplanes sp. CA-051413]|uniref:hypothetical protein n=1 Tax=Actinoplanes sp. CA-051413 TaxID=3239899 RepID=UPI003D96EECF
MRSPNTMTTDLVLTALREADKPLTVAEVRQQVKAATNISLDRTTTYSALKRCMVHSQAACDLGDDNVTRWYAIPEPS